VSVDGPPVFLVGEGNLATRMAARLLQAGQAARQVSREQARAMPESGPILLVAAFDHPAPAAVAELNDLALQRGARFVPAWLEYGRALIGPVVQADTGDGCARCSEARRLNNHPYSVYYRAALKQRELDASAESCPAPAIVDMVAELVASLCDDARAYASQVGGRIWVIGLDTLAVGEHRFMPDPNCPACGALPEDTADAARLDLQPFATEGAWRARDLRQVGAALEDACVDPVTGLVTTLGIDITNPLLAIAAGRFRLGTSHVEEWTGGLTTHFAVSRAVAIVEALERHAGLRARGKRTTVRGTFNDLRNDAVDPRSLILHDPAQYAAPGFPCVPFHDDLCCSWVWGHCFRRNQPVLVPEQLAYYELGQYEAATRFVVETSSGCATGSSIEEAILYGLLEAIERDAVLRVWYSRTTPARVDLSQVRSRRLLLLIDRLREETGAELHALDVSQEFGVPSLWLMLVNPDDRGPKTLSGSKSHPDAEIALEGALCELASAVHFNRKQYDERRPQLLRMLEDISLVVDRFDHSLLAALPEAFDRYAFLIAGTTPKRPLNTPPWRTTAAWIHEPDRGLGRLIGRVLDGGHDVVVVNQTTSEQRRLGLHTVKVLVPGLLPFNIGHRFRRTASSRRVPPSHCINDFPHPFP
jgi:ribosomal protein S12 methylthiotransferase accessory factor